MASVVGGALHKAHQAAQLIEGTLKDAVLKLADDYETLVNRGVNPDGTAEQLKGLKKGAQKLADVVQHLDVPEVPAPPVVKGT